MDGSGTRSEESRVREGVQGRQCFHVGFGHVRVALVADVQAGEGTWRARQEEGEGDALHLLELG